MKEVTRVFTHGFTGAHKEHFLSVGAGLKLEIKSEREEVQCQ